MLDHASILKWYSGKAHMRAGAALQVLDRAIERGAWAKGEARKTRAALRNATVAQKVAARINGVRELFPLYMALRYGDSYVTSSMDLARMYDAAVACKREVDLAQGLMFITQLQPVYQALNALDITKPQPTITALGVSPTMTKTLDEAGLAPTTVRVCAIEWSQQAVQDAEGNKTIVSVGRLLWPENTLHNYTRFARVKAGHTDQCHACGHVIRNPFNWVPLLVDSAEDGTPHSMWVGKDCAHSLFGIKVAGELRLRPQ